MEWKICKKPVDLEIMVKDYCKSRGVNIVFAKVYLLRFDDSTANCRVTVRDYDESKLLESRFWPSGVTSRECIPTPLYNLAKKGGNAAVGNANAQ